MTEDKILTKNIAAEKVILSPEKIDVGYFIV